MVSSSTSYQFHKSGSGFGISHPSNDDIGAISFGFFVRCNSYRFDPVIVSVKSTLIRFNKFDAKKKKCFFCELQYDLSWAQSFGQK